MTRHRARTGVPSGRSPARPRPFPGDVRVAPLIPIQQLLTEFGVDPAATLTAAGAPPDLFVDPDQRVDFQLVARLFKICVERTGCAHFGLLVGQRTELSALGALDDLMENSHTVGDALRLGAEHLEVNDRGAISFVLDVGNGRTGLGYALFGGATTGMVQVLDGAIAIQNRLLRSLCGPAWRPLLVRLSRARPADAQPYRAAFGDRLEFESDASMILFESSWLDRPIAGADTNAFLTAARTIQINEARDPVPFEAQARRAIYALLFTGSASTRQLARVFDLPPRTLRRRLAADGATVRGLVNEVRCDLALHLLNDTRLGISDVAAALHYADPTVFSRAFRSWTGSSPRQWRSMDVRRSRRTPRMHPWK